MADLPTSLDPEETFRSARDHLAPGLVLAQRLAGRGAVEVSGHGSWIRLSDRREVLDLGSYSVPLVGHCNPRVVSAVREQISAMPVSSRTLANPIAAELARTLISRLGAAELRRVWFGLNGCDAVEVALKLAWARSGKRRILAVEGAFHGKSLAAVSATHLSNYRAPVSAVIPPVTHIPVEATAVAREVSQGDVAALIVEPVQGENGASELPSAVIRRWLTDARSAHVPVIADEVQCGLYRCGALSVSLDLGVVPDAILFGKALGGGVLPISAMVATDDYFRPLIEDPLFHTSTFSGYPAGCAAALSLLQLVEELAPRIATLGQRLDSLLRGLAKRYSDLVRVVTGQGLLRGVHFIDPRASGEVMFRLAELGLLVSPCLSAPAALRLAPPATITDAELDQVHTLLDHALAGQRPSAVKSSRYSLSRRRPGGSRSASDQMPEKRNHEGFYLDRQ